MEFERNAYHHLSLLVVEDDRAANQILTTMIPRKFPGIAIYVAYNGTMGLELFREHTPDIVITDINMPEMDGIQMADGIREMKSDTKFIVLTGYSDRIHLEKFDRMGIHDYMMKPIDFKKLFASIDRCIDEIVQGRPGFQERCTSVG